MDKLRTLARDRFAWAAAAALALVFAAYANHFDNSFHFDDSHTIVQNLHVRDLRNVPRFFVDTSTFSTLPPNRVWRPVVTTTLAIDWQLGKGTTRGFHAGGFSWFLLHLGAVFALLRLALDRAAPGPANRWLALLGATLFGAHAAVAETVNYVIARSDVLSALGATGCVAIWAAFPGLRRWGVHLVPAALGVMSKEQGAMAAPLLFLWIGLVEQGRTVGELLRPRHLWAALRPALPAFALCFGLVALGQALAHSFAPGGASRLHYALTQPFVLLHYVGQFLLPLGLTADTDMTVVSGLRDPRVAAGAAFLVALGAAVVALARSPALRPAAFGLLWFVVALLPTSSVIPLAEVMNDHRMYFPFVGLVLAVAVVLREVLPRLPAPWPRVAAGGLVLLLLAHAAGVHARNRVWRTEESLWRDVTEKSPRNGRGWMNYGLALMGQGRWAEAEAAYLRALELVPSYSYLHVNLAILRAATGRDAEAERSFRTALALSPGLPAVHRHYASWLHARRRHAEALAQVRLAVAAAPADLDARHLLLDVLGTLGHRDELAREAEATLRLDPRDRAAQAALARARAGVLGPDPGAEAQRLVQASLEHYRAGRFQESLAAATRAAALDPALAVAQNNRCSALNALGRHEEAAAACREAIRLDPALDIARNNLRAAEAALPRR